MLPLLRNGIILREQVAPTGMASLSDTRPTAVGLQHLAVRGRSLLFQALAAYLHAFL